VADVSRGKKASTGMPAPQAAAKINGAAASQPLKKMARGEK
jgi:hypothetical protein